MKQIKAARFLVRKHAPYIGPVMDALELVVRDDIPFLMATDGTRLYVNPIKLVDLPATSVAKVLIHECLHVILRHTAPDSVTARKAWVEQRAGLRWIAPGNSAPRRTVDAMNAYIWAEEAYVNALVDAHPECARWTWPGSPPLYTQVSSRRPTGGTMAYATFVTQCLTEAPLGLADPVTIPSDALAGEATAGSRRLAIAVAAATVQIRARAPAAWRHEVGEPVTPIERWRDHLSRHLRVVVGRGLDSSSYTYSKLHRRQSVLGYGHNRPRLAAPVIASPRVGIAIDTSGSMLCDNLLERGLGIILEAVQSCGGSVIVIFADDAVAAYGDVATEDEARALFKGGGGTDFAPAIAKAEEIGLDALVYFTDGYGYFPEQPDNLHVVWCSTTPKGLVRFPFGEVVYGSRD